MSSHSSSQPVQVFVLLSVIFGGITTLFRYDGYGISDQIEQLPIILRILDNSYLPHDFFVNASAEFGPRWYFSHLIAFLAGTPDRLPGLFWGLTLLANTAISVISFFFARKLFDSPRAGIIANALVMSLPTFKLGFGTEVYQTLLIESTLSIPLVLLAVLVSSHGHLLPAILISGLAAVIHPLFGLETGSLILVSFGLVELHRVRSLARLPWKLLLISAGFLGGVSLLWVLPLLSQKSIASETFVYIVAFFRHPHHYAPSTFALSDYGAAFSFFAAMAVAWHHWQHKLETPSFTTHFLTVFTLLIGLGCLAGYIFVEIIPVRLVVTAQLFRLLYFLKWLGLVFMGGSIAHFLEHESDGTAGMLLVGVLSPFTAGIAFVSQFLHPRLGAFVPAIKIILAPLLILLFTVTLLFQIGFRNVLFFIIFLLLWVFTAVDRKWLYGTALISILGVSILTPFRNQVPLPRAVKNFYEGFDTKFQITYSDMGIQGQAIAEFARQNTPPESVFLTPPAFGQFRLIAERAIVIDFKAFPFQDLAMQDWYLRFITVYGLPTVYGFDMVPELEKSYQTISDEHILLLQAEYGFEYAVLFRETETQFPVLFRNNRYKIVALPSGIP